MEDKVEDYQRLLCSICKNKNVCNKDEMKIHIYDKTTSIQCPKYKYENDLT